MNVIKRNGESVPYDFYKIHNAVKKADMATNCELRTIDYTNLRNYVERYICHSTRPVTVEDIQDWVIRWLITNCYVELSKNYITYRYDRMLRRQNKKFNDKIYSIVDGTNTEIDEENTNKKAGIIPTQRDYIAGEVSKDITFTDLLPEHIVNAHNQGLIHFHDADYFVQHSYNCCLVNLEDMFQYGTVISDKQIDKPKTFSTGCTIATQIIAQVASNQYGGQTISLAHLIPLVEDTRNYWKEKLTEKLADKMQEEDINELVEDMVYHDINKGIQTLQYQILTLMTTNGQTPFITVNVDIEEVPRHMRDDFSIVIRELLNQRIKGVKNKKGVWVMPTFPKIIYVLRESNCTENSKYWYLTELAALCSAYRMVPDYISAKKMMELKGDVYPCMGCRSFLTKDRTTENLANANNWVKGKKYYGRFNQGVVTLNLVDVALSSRGDYGKFWDIMNERLALCYEALMIRHNRLKGTTSDVAPILWQHGAIARLQPGEKIDKLLYGGYSTISLGYGGLYECVKYMTGKSHTDHEAESFAKAVMQALNDACEKWKAETDIDFSVYGTPMESTTYKFARCLQKRFGVIEGITDRNYITNSYHVPVFEKIDAFNKLKFEGVFQALSPGGAISYVEVPNLTKNVKALLEIIKYMYNNTLYSEANTKADYCFLCDYTGEMILVENESKKLVWTCPNCGNTNRDKMTIVRRTCGYLGENEGNEGRKGEFKDRVLHL